MTTSPRSTARWLRVLCLLGVGSVALAAYAMKVDKEKLGTPDPETMRHEEDGPS